MRKRVVKIVLRVCGLLAIVGILGGNIMAGHGRGQDSSGRGIIVAGGGPQPDPNGPSTIVAGGGAAPDRNGPWLMTMNG